MKKIRRILLSAAVVLTLIPVVKTNTVTVEAKTTYNLYSMTCSGSTSYEVDTVNDSGTFDYKGCYVDFSSAKSAMKAAGDNAVVRHAGSYSANQIIAMTRGYVYSSAFRDNSNTLSITQNVSSNPASTYVQNYRGMYYEDTLSYDGNGDGSVLVNAFGFEGVVSLKDVDFIPMRFYEIDKPIYVGGNSYDNAAPWYVTPSLNFYRVEKNGSYLDLVYYGYNDYPSGGAGAHPECYTGSLAVGPAASWMTEGAVYYSLDDVTFYSDYQFTKVAGTYYNYYLYQPFRTKSKISAEQYNTFLSAQGYSSNSVLWNTGSTFLADQEQYGINAAMVFAEACVEAAYGTSYYAKQYNNLFGVGAYDNGPQVRDFTQTGGVAESINYQMGILLRYYTDTDCSWFYGGYFGNKGSGITTKYASSATYGMTLASVYYRFDKIASGNNGSLTDWQSSAIGVVNKVTSIYSNSNLSNVLYNTTYGYNTSYQKNHIVVILSDMGNCYKIQSTDYVADGVQMHPANETYTAYDWNNMVGYVNKSDVTVVGTAKIPNSVSISNFVTQLYTNVLERSPDEQGLNNWVNQLQSGSMTGSQVADAFFFSAEFTKKNYCNKHFVEHLYKALLGRNADTEGLNSWISALNNNVSREAVANGFLLSGEFSAICASNGINRGNGISVPLHGTIQTEPCSIDGIFDNSLGMFVERLYTKCLNRNYDPDGLANWILQINKGMSGSELAAGFFFSAEFTNANYDNSTYINRLYESFFDRAADVNGYNNWIEQLNNGVSRETVFNGFANSAEWHDFCSKNGINS